VFQLEQGEKTGMIHWQCRVSLIKKSRRDTLKNSLKGTVLENAYVCPTSNANSRNFNYVMKVPTRLAGPWDDKMPDPDDMDDELRQPPLEWQNKIIEEIKGPIHMRKVIVLHDEKGGKGKTWLMKYIRYNKLGTVIPSFTKFEDIAQMVMCKPTDRCYIIDMPRSVEPHKLQGFWTGIESIKNGYCYDKRHKFQDRVFKSPHVIVLTNRMPVLTHLSEDRWDIRNL